MPHIHIPFHLRTLCAPLFIHLTTFLCYTPLGQPSKIPTSPSSHAKTMTSSHAKTLLVNLFSRSSLTPFPLPYTYTFPPYSLLCTQSTHSPPHLQAPITVTLTLQLVFSFLLLHLLFPSSFTSSSLAFPHSSLLLPHIISYRHDSSLSCLICASLQSPLILYTNTLHPFPLTYPTGKPPI